MRVINLLAGLTGAYCFIMLAGAHHSGADAGNTLILAALAQIGAAAAGLAVAQRTSRLALIGAAILLAGANLFATVLYLNALVGAHPLHMLAPIGGTLLIAGWAVLAFAK